MSLTLLILLACGDDNGARKLRSQATDSGRVSPTTLVIQEVWETTPNTLRSPKHHPTVAIGAGPLVVGWDEETNPPGAYLRVFDTLGQPRTDYQRFTPCPEQVPCRPSVAPVDGGFWVGWADDEAVKAARFDHDLNRVGSTVYIAESSLDGRLEAPAIAPMADGGLVVVWFGSQRLEGDSTSQYSLASVGTDGVVTSLRELDTATGGASPPDIVSTELGFSLTWVTREPLGTDGMTSTLWLAELDSAASEVSRRSIWMSDTTATRPMLTASAEDRAVVWREDRPERVSWLQVLPAHRAPPPPVLLNTGEADKPVVELLAGVAVVAFDVTPEPMAGRVYVQPFALETGEALQEPVQVWGAGGSEQRPAMTTDDSEVWIAFREDMQGTGTPGTIRVARVRLE